MAGKRALDDELSRFEAELSGLTEPPAKKPAPAPAPAAPPAPVPPPLAPPMFPPRVNPLVPPIPPPGMPPLPPPGMLPPGALPPPPAHGMPWAPVPPIPPPGMFPIPPPGMPPMMPPAMPTMQVVSLSALTQKAPENDEGEDGAKKKPKKEKKEKGKTDKKLLRVAAGQVWADETMAEWDPNDFRIFVGDLGNDTTDDMLARAFQMYPTFRKAKIIRDKRSNKSKGYGFVSFKDSKDYIRAMKEMNGKYCGNRPMKLRKSTWEDRSFLNKQPMKKKN